MNIGLFNLHWSTLGGGERHAAAMARALSEVGRVELIGRDPLEIGRLEAHLGIDLTGISFRDIGYGGLPELQRASIGYDLFINSSFRSDLPSLAPRSIFNVFFPQRFTSPVTGRVADAMGTAVAPPSLIEPLEGFQPTTLDGKAWAGPTATVRIRPQAFVDGELTIGAISQGRRSLEESIVSVSGHEIDWRVDDEALTLIPRGRCREPIVLEIRSRPSEVSDSRIDSPIAIRLDLSCGGGAIHSIRRRIARRLGRHSRGSSREFLSTYDLFLANSEFTRGWIDRRWSVPSTALPPPIDTSAFRVPAGTAKEKVILAVGRFFAGAHNKKHLEMIGVFRDLCDHRRLPEGWELHLVGNVHRDSPADHDYFADIQRLAEGYPIRVLPQLSFERLRGEYHRASIFWHATGLGESERRRPEKLEHFGITTCEAMSARCVPIVIAKAGQLEVLDDAQSGFFFSTREQLGDRTAKVVGEHDADWVERMRERASIAADRFSATAYDRRLLEILERNGLIDRA